MQLIRQNTKSRQAIDWQCRRQLCMPNQSYKTNNNLTARWQL